MFQAIGLDCLAHPTHPIKNRWLDELWPGRNLYQSSERKELQLSQLNFQNHNMGAKNMPCFEQIWRILWIYNA